MAFAHHSAGLDCRCVASLREIGHRSNRLLTCRSRTTCRHDTSQAAGRERQLRTAGPAHQNLPQKRSHLMGRFGELTRIPRDWHGDKHENVSIYRVFGAMFLGLPPSAINKSHLTDYVLTTQSVSAATLVLRPRVAAPSRFAPLPLRRRCSGFGARNVRILEVSTARARETNAMFALTHTGRQAKELLRATTT